ncbi:MAG: hypothetical protein LBN10_11815 [Propionibacteriaceae bacterium]|nr:hypothetical protein [Propionibacteriaceae bacterium]
MSWKKALAGLAAAVVMCTGLAGCSPSPGTVAIVSGETITQGHVNSAVDTLRIITARTQGSESLATPQFVIRYEIFHLLFEQANAKLGLSITDDDRVTMLEQQYGTTGLAADLWNDPETVEAMKGILDFDIANSLISYGAVNTQEFLDALAAPSVKINPRYGGWDFNEMNLTSSTVLGGPMADATPFTVPL